MEMTAKKNTSKKDMESLFPKTPQWIQNFLFKVLNVEFITAKHGKDNCELTICKVKGNKPRPAMPLDFGLELGVPELPIIAAIFARFGYIVFSTRSILEVAHTEVDSYFDALDCIWENYGFVDKRLTIPIGVSSGGSLALGLAADPRASAYNIKGAIGLSPYHSLLEMYPYMRDYVKNNKDPNDYHYEVLKLYKEYAETNMMDFDTNGTPIVKAEYEAASPENFIKDIIAKILLVHGEADKIVPKEQAVKNNELAKSLGKDVRLKIVPGESVHTPPNEMLKIKNLIGEIKTAVEIWRFLDRIKREVYPENYNSRPTY